MIQNDSSLKDRLLFYVNPLDGRYEDLRRGNWKLNVVSGRTRLILALILSREISFTSTSLLNNLDTVTLALMFPPDIKVSFAWYST